MKDLKVWVQPRQSTTCPRTPSWPCSPFQKEGTEYFKGILMSCLMFLQQAQGEARCLREEHNRGWHQDSQEQIQWPHFSSHSRTILKHTYITQIFQRLLVTQLVLENRDASFRIHEPSEEHYKTVHNWGILAIVLHCTPDSHLQEGRDKENVTQNHKSGMLEYEQSDDSKYEELRKKWMNTFLKKILT